MIESKDMKKATPEQLAARAEKKARMRAFAATISKMSPEQKANLARTCPVVTIEGRALSYFNQCMIALQMPSATVIGGFRQWIKAGRSVQKGEQALIIWVPIGTKSADQATGLTETTQDEKRFILGSVFDVSQTKELETETLPEPEAEDRARTDPTLADNQHDRDAIIDAQLGLI